MYNVWYRHLNSLIKSRIYSTLKQFQYGNGNKFIVYGRLQTLEPDWSSLKLSNNYNTKLEEVQRPRSSGLSIKTDTFCTTLCT